MKKIIKISILTFGVCFIAGKANAQLASDQPAFTAAQVQQLRSVPTATVNKAQATSVQTASMKPTTGAASGALKAGIATIAIPSQGGVVTPTERPVSEIKAAVISTQTEEKEKKNNR
jgi:outer membrane lipoprotein SlyB